MKDTHMSFSFTSQLSNLKNTLTLWEDVISKTMKLSTSIKSVIQCVAGFLEAFQRLADSAYSSNCGLRELGSSMTRFCLRERGLESRLRTLNSQLLDCLAAPLADRLEEWRRTVAQLDRENNKEWRRARSELQRVSCEVDKLNRRFRRKTSVSARPDQFSSDQNSSVVDLQTGENVQLNFMHHDLELKQRSLAELERTNLRRAVVEERRRFSELITCLRPVLDSQLALLTDVKSLDECASAITKLAVDPNELPSDTEQAIDEAVERVSTRTHQRKMSDVRSAMRFARSALSGHGSQLSLQSALSTCTTSSWNNTGANDERPNSPGYTNPLRGDYHRPSAVVSANRAQFVDPPPPGVDCLSLFESNEANADPNLAVDTQRTGIATVKNHYYTPLDLAPPSCTDYSTDSNETDLLHNSKEAEDQTGEDTVGDNTGGANTEDTEDGETEDEEHISASNNVGHDHPKSILYPNQAIPAPVYTNLHELKKAAAKKFSLPDGFCDHPSDSGSSDLSNRISGHHHPHQQQQQQPNSIDFPAPVLPALDPSLPLPTEARPFSTAQHQAHSLDGGVPDGYISTCIASGTSTFRRKQSVPGEMCYSNTQQSGAAPSNHGSFTPTVNRRATQPYLDMNERENGRCRTRPANPPRRSSSVSRDMTRIRPSNVEHYAPPSLRHNPIGLDPPGSIHRVSGSVFAQPDLSAINRTDARALPADPCQYASISVPKTLSNGRAPERLSGMPRLTPPPLATVHAPKGNQPFFGIKVLPTQALSTNSPTEFPFSQSNRLGPRPMLRQSSCDVSALPMQNRYARTRDTFHSSRHSQEHADVVRDDAITSFID